MYTKLKRFFVSMLLVVIMIMLPVDSVRAEQVTRIKCSGKAESVKQLSKSLNKVLSDFSDYKSKTLILYDDVLKNVSRSERKTIVNKLILAVSNSSVPDKCRNQISNAINSMYSDISAVTESLDSDTSEEIRESLTIWGRASKYINIGLGLFILAVIIGIPLALLNDMAFMFIEPYTELLQGDDLTKKPKFISYTAYSVRKDIVATEGKKQALGLYIRKQWKILLILFILIVLILKNQLFGVIGTLFDYIDI